VVGAASFLAVMAGLVPAIHVFCSQENKTWMPGTRPGMTGPETQRMAATHHFCLAERPEPG